MMGLFVATPMYGGQCYGAYTDSVIKLAVMCAGGNIEFEFYAVFNESHIDRGRNTCVNGFLNSGCSHLLFIDSDISFRAEDAIMLLEQDKDIVCGFYAKKAINWQSVADAVRAGFADEDPRALAHFAGDMVYTPALSDESYQSRSIYDLAPLHEGGTGFMLIRRHVFERIAARNPELTYINPGPKREPRVMFFDAKIEPGDMLQRRHLTEDYDFCRLAREAGFTIWLAPWIKLTHHGYHQFVGDVQAIGAIQQAKQGKAA